MSSFVVVGLLGMEVPPCTIYNACYYIASAVICQRCDSRFSAFADHMKQNKNRREALLREVPPSRRLSGLCKLFVHGRGVGLADGLAHLGDLHLQRALAKGDLDHIAHLDLVARLDLTAVDRDALAVAGLVCDGPAFNECSYTRYPHKKNSSMTFTFIQVIVR